MNGRSIRGLLAVASICLAAGRASAGGFASLSVLPDQATAVTTTPVASYTNPAALHAKSGLRLYLDTTLLSRSASFKRQGSDTPEPPGAAGANAGTARLSNTLLAPTFSLAYTRDRIAVGLGMFLPFGGAAEWNPNERFANDSNFVGAVDSQARWFGISSVWNVTYVSGAVSYRLLDRLSIGVSGNLVLEKVRLTQALTTLLDDSLVGESRANYHLDKVDGSFGLGVHWEAIAEKLWLGLSYQAPPGLWDGSLLKGDLELRYANGAPSPPRSIYLRQKYPDIIQFGARLRASPNWELRLTGNYQRWSVVRSQCLTYSTKPCAADERGVVAPSDGIFANWARRWHDTFGLRAAATYFLGSKTLFGLGTTSLFGAVAYDGTAVPKGTLEPSVMDGKDVTFNLGARWQMFDSVALAASIAWQHMLTRDNRGDSTLADYPLPTHVPSANGIYRQDLVLANTNIEVTFDGF